MRIRLLRDADWETLPEVFNSAFARVSPFSSMNDDEQLGAARDSLGFTQRGGNGPLVHEACLVAADAKENSIVGGFLVMLVPDVPLSEIGFGHVPSEGVAPGKKLVLHLDLGVCQVLASASRSGCGNAGQGGGCLEDARSHALDDDLFARQRVEYDMALADVISASVVCDFKRQLGRRASKASNKPQFSQRQTRRKPAKR